MTRRPLLPIVLELGPLATPAAVIERTGCRLRDIDAAIAAREIRYGASHRGVLEPVPSMGRPPRAGVTADVRIGLDVTAAERRAIRAAARLAGQPASSWVRARALEAGPLLDEGEGKRGRLMVRLTPDERAAIERVADGVPLRRWMRGRALAEAAKAVRSR